MDRFRDRQSRGVFSEVHIAKLTNLPLRLDAETQTAPFTRRKQLRFPMKEHAGEHKAVQVVEAELFDFDREAAPVVKALVNRVLTEARLEAWDEGKREYMRAQKQQMDQSEAKRLSKMRAFEHAERQRRDRARLQRFERDRTKKQLQATHKKLLGRELAKAYVGVLHAQAERRMERMSFAKQERAEQAVRSEVVEPVEQLVFAQIGGRREVGRLLESLFGEVKRRFKGRFELETDRFRE